MNRPTRSSAPHVSRCGVIASGLGHQVSGLKTDTVMVDEAHERSLSEGLCLPDLPLVHEDPVVDRTLLDYDIGHGRMLVVTDTTGSTMGLDHALPRVIDLGKGTGVALEGINPERSPDLLVPNEGLESALVRSERAGVVVFAAAKGRQLSLEPSNSRGLELDSDATTLVRLDSGNPHGFFTGAFLQALSDAATDTNRNGSIELSEVVDEVTRRVRVASKGAQTPWVARRELFGDFVLAPAREPH